MIVTKLSSVINKLKQTFKKSSLIYPSIFIGVFLFTIICVIIVEGLVRMPFKTITDEKTWIGFYGSFFGGIIGGTGTLLAVYFTTKETRSIQRRSENILDMSEKRRFSDEVAKIVAEYITDISAYYYSNRSTTGISKNIQCFEKQISDVDNEINKKEWDSIMSNLANDKDEYIKTQNDLTELRGTKDSLINKISSNQNEFNRISRERTIANNGYFLLKIKLNNIITATDLLNSITYIHKCSADLSIEQSEFNKEIDKLIEVLTIFINDYLTVT